MDKTTKLYIDDIVKPLLSRIELLERSNEELKVQVRYLESLINHAPSYQKPTRITNHIQSQQHNTCEIAGSVAEKGKANYPKNPTGTVTPKPNTHPVDHQSLTTTKNSKQNHPSPKSYAPLENQITKKSEVTAIRKKFKVAPNLPQLIFLRANQARKNNLMGKRMIKKT
jgi:hypothetical protein